MSIQVEHRKKTGMRSVQFRVDQRVWFWHKVTLFSVPRSCLQGSLHGWLTTLPIATGPTWRSKGALLLIPRVVDRCLQSRLEQHLSQFLHIKGKKKVRNDRHCKAFALCCEDESRFIIPFTCLPDGTVGSPHSKTFFSSVSKSPFPAYLKP
jgi:hypothetical protein